MPTTTVTRLPQALGERIDIHPTVESLRELILASAEQADLDRRLPEELIDAMSDAGIFDTMRPRELGGLELHPFDFLDLAFELSRINGTVGWITLFQNGSLPLLPVPVMKELMDVNDGRLIFSGSHARVGRAVRVDGGFRFSGDWFFASGSPWATHMTAWAEVIGPDGEPEKDPETGESIKVDGIARRDQVDFQDGWHTFGLRGSGSGAFALHDAFIEERFVTRGILPDEYADRPIYTSFWDAVGVTMMYLGCAQGAIDRYIASPRRALIGDPALASLRQVQLGEAEALVRSAREYARSQVPDEVLGTAAAPEANDDDWAPSHSSPVGGPIDFMIPIADNLQAATHCARVAKQALNIVFDIAGSDAVRTNVGIERCLRDAYTGAQHAGVSYRNFALRGEYLMTKDSEEGPSITVPKSLG
jgi:alkylation response protein AidB-like acyl-CoA dehydrogenase